MIAQEFFESPAGDKQGCLLNPPPKKKKKKSCLLIHELADEIRRAGKRGTFLSNLTDDIFSLQFVDVVALVSHTVEELQNQLNVLARASAKIGLTVNLDKTKVMVLEKEGTLQRMKKWFLNGQRHEVVNLYVYLGSTLTTKLSVSNALEPIAIKAKNKNTGNFYSA